MDIKCKDCREERCQKCSKFLRRRGAGYLQSGYNQEKSDIQFFSYIFNQACREMKGSLEDQELAQVDTSAAFKVQKSRMEVGELKYTQQSTQTCTNVHKHNQLPALRLLVLVFIFLPMIPAAASTDSQRPTNMNLTRIYTTAEPRLVLRLTCGDRSGANSLQLKVRPTQRTV